MGFKISIPKPKIPGFAKKALKTATGAVKTGLAVKNTVQSLAKDGFGKAARSSDRLGLFGVTKKVMGATGVITGVVKLPGQAATAFRDIRDAVKNGTRDSFNAAFDSTASLLKGGISTTKGALTTARDLHKYGSAYRAAKGVLTATPGLSKGVMRAASRAAARSAFEGGSSFAVQQATSRAIKTASTRGGATVARSVAGSGSRAASRAVMAQAGKGAARAAAGAAARSAAGPLAKAAGRFVPGANVALAAIDTAVAIKTITDPNASVGAKITSGVTALGSIAAATNIPVVSQVGAGVAAVSSFIGGLF